MVAIVVEGTFIVIEDPLLKSYKLRDEAVQADHIANVYIMILYKTINIIQYGCTVYWNLGISYLKISPKAAKYDSFQLCSIGSG